jgi:hypothetical protein
MEGDHHVARPFTIDISNVFKEEEPSRKTVSQVADRRHKRGVLEYKVFYGENGPGRPRWVPAEELDCADLIQAYEEARERDKAAFAERKVFQIVGIVPSHFRPRYAVLFDQSSKPEIVSREYLHKTCPELLLEWYESHLAFDDSPDSQQPKPKKPKPARLKQTIPAETDDSVPPASAE